MQASTHSVLQDTTDFEGNSQARFFLIDFSRLLVLAKKKTSLSAESQLPGCTVSPFPASLTAELTILGSLSSYSTTTARRVTRPFKVQFPVN